ncbi:MAG: diacylglycerol kinase family lipid kinase [Eubacterium sp.]|nr:diacylglycerol kinase family lipid kinase [Eubacterium sp.]
MNKKLLLIVNPISGRKKAGQYMPSIITKFDDADFDVKTVCTLKEKNAYDIVKELGEQADIIVCVGGDGTLKETVTGIIELGLTAPLGYIPMGSTNDFARSLGIPRNDVMAAVDNIIEGKPHPVDIGLFENEAFIYVAAFGNFCALSYTANQKIKNALGRVAYYLPVAKDFLHMRPYHARVEADGEFYEDDYFLGAASNSYGVGGMPLLKNAGVEFDDGYHELVLIRMFKNVKEALAFIKDIATRNIKDNPMVKIRKCKNIRFMFDEPTAFTLDGEFGGDRLDVTAKTLEHAVNIIIKD